jgi:hypothetical protein
VKPPAHEHEFEAAHGLPEALPAGERILWQGAPQWRVLAVQVMHVRTLAVYFALMLLWRAVTAFYDGGGLSGALLSVALLAPLAVLALGILSYLAWLTSRTTVYTVTNRRIVMRIGIVLSVTFNLPYRMLDAASMRLNRDGSGDLSLLLAPGERIAYANLWPHARPWQVKRSQPMLRAIPEAARVGEVITNAMAAVAEIERKVPAARPQAVSTTSTGQGHALAA